MNFYEELKDMTDEEIEKHLSYEIYNLENRSKQNNDGDVIGYNVPYNPTGIDLLRKEEFAIPIKLRCFYGGYVPKGTKVVYGFASDINGSFANEGRYYIVDDDSYIYDFCKYIKDIDIKSEGDLFRHILTFLKTYLGGIPNRSRDEMFQMVLKNDKIYHDPINEHKLSDFKHKGNAMCSEYTIMANNILSVFGFDSYVIMGHEKDIRGVEGHAFNFVSYTNEKYERVDVLMDFFNDVDIYDVSFNKLGSCPYIRDLDDLNNEFVYEFINSKRHIVDNEYCIMVIGKSLFEVLFDRTRDYFIQNELKVDFTSTNCQKVKK